MTSNIPVRRSTRTRTTVSKSTNLASSADVAKSRGTNTNASTTKDGPTTGGISSKITTTTTTRVTTSSAVNLENRPRTRAAAKESQTAKKAGVGNTNVRAAVKKIESSSSTSDATNGAGSTRKRGALMEVTRTLGNNKHDAEDSKARKGKARPASEAEDQQAPPVFTKPSAAPSQSQSSSQPTRTSQADPPRVFSRPRQVSKRLSGDAVEELDDRAPKRRALTTDSNSSQPQPSSRVHSKPSSSQTYDASEDTTETRLSKRRVRDAERLAELKQEEARRQAELLAMREDEDSIDYADVENRGEAEILDSVDEVAEVLLKNRMVPTPPSAIEEEEEDVRAREREERARQLPAVSDEEEVDEEEMWDDLDAEDMDDPVMVAEYAVEAIAYLREQELTTVPSPTYMTRQPELSFPKRSILINWLITVHTHLRLLPETLFLTVNILDRFLSLRPVSEAKFQLVGITSLLLACKYEETYSPSITELVELTGGIFKKEDVIKAERFVLKTLGWTLSFYPGPMSFLRRASRADNTEPRARTIAKYLCELTLTDPSLFHLPPSLVAASAMWLGRMVMGREVWGANMRRYSGYGEDEVMGGVSGMVRWLVRGENNPSNVGRGGEGGEGPNEAVLKKYASRRYLKASVFMHQWAVGLWGEEADLGEDDLRADLPALKKHIREERERELMKATEEFATVEGEDEI